LSVRRYRTSAENGRMIRGDGVLEYGCPHCAPKGRAAVTALHKLIFVSSNAEKHREIRDALRSAGWEVERAPVDVAEIQSLDPAMVAEHKARLAFEHLGGEPILVEDTGLALTAWNGYPGALIKWVLGAVGEEGLCRQLDAWADRSAVATVALCLYDGADARLFLGTTRGTITNSPRGKHGFGWDSIFQPEGYTQTYGEMLREAKMGISMRAQAVAALREYLLGGAV